MVIVDGTNSATNFLNFCLYYMRIYLLLSLSCFFSFFLYGQHVTIDSSKSVSKITGEQVEILVDSTGKLDEKNIVHTSGFKFSSGVPNFSSAPNNIWIKFSLQNNTIENKVHFIINYANISDIKLYSNLKDSLTLIATLGNKYPFNKILNANVNFNIKIDLDPGATGEYYMHISSLHPLQLPMYVEIADNKNTLYQNQILVIGVYAGLIISILLYNLFLFFSTRDKSYFYYVVYLASLLFAQLTFAGWSFKYIWPVNPAVNTYAVVVSSSLVGITALLFSLNFLHIKKYSNFLKLLFYTLMLSYFVAIVGSFFSSLSFSYTLLSYNGIIGGLLLLIASGYIARKGYRPANYYFLAFFIFSIGRVILSLRNLGVLPYNNFTSYILYIGSAIETLLLSFALADKINILQKEKNDTQQLALEVSKENAKLIFEQNIVLEQKVAERTTELQNSNMQLSTTLNDLKDTQTQLVEAEKMASLGQLTAGIAHEINNPINFVKSNIKPLRLDIEDIFNIIDDYTQLHGKNKIDIEHELNGVYAKQQAIGIDFIKNEVQQLIKGIEDGAERTAEIVRGLRIFSRLDESELKTANIHDGIESTMVLLRNSMPSNITIEKKFTAKGNIECYPGKLNQVFMNILNNAIQAIGQKKEPDNPHLISIETCDTSDNNILINIKDTGIGMSEDVLRRIYEPFFTTKSVGEGTGLGMAIVFKIIEAHCGNIEVSSQPGKGSEFSITLPYTHPDK